MSAILTQIPNLLLAIDAVDSIISRFQKVASSMRLAVEEGRDMTADELEQVRQDAEDEDTLLEASIERARERERQTALAQAGSDKVTGETGGDLRP